MDLPLVGVAPLLGRGRVLEQGLGQVVTRRRPYDGRNFMGVLTDVLAGARPSPLPTATSGGGDDCPVALVELMQRCWAAEPDERPSMADVVGSLESLAAPAANMADTSV